MATKGLSVVTGDITTAMKFKKTMSQTPLLKMGVLPYSLINKFVE